MININNIRRSTPFFIQKSIMQVKWLSTVKMTFSIKFILFLESMWTHFVWIQSAQIIKIFLALISMKHAINTLYTNNVSSKYNYLKCIYTSTSMEKIICHAIGIFSNVEEKFSEIVFSTYFLQCKNVLILAFCIS